MKLFIIVFLSLFNHQSVAAFSHFKVLDKITTQYDVDKNNNPDTEALSQWVEETWLGLPQGKFAAQQWVHTKIIDFYPVDYSWGPPPTLPGLSGRFNAARIFGVPLGSFRSDVIWSTTTTQNAFNILSSPAQFDVLDCGLISCTPRYSVTLNRHGGSTAKYHVPQNTPISPNSPSGLRSSNSSSRVIDVAAGETLSIGASLDFMDMDANQREHHLFAFNSRVENLDNGNYRYQYEMVNNSALDVDAFWQALAPDIQNLGIDDHNNSVLIEYISDKAPIEAHGYGKLTAHGAFSDAELSGAIRFFKPVPLPTSLWLFITAVIYITTFCRHHR